jgi:hypothetical protein
VPAAFAADATRAIASWAPDAWSVRTSAAGSDRDEVTSSECVTSAEAAAAGRLLSDAAGAPTCVACCTAAGAAVASPLACAG